MTTDEEHDRILNNWAIEKTRKLLEKEKREKEIRRYKREAIEKGEDFVDPETRAIEESDGPRMDIGTE